MTERAAGTASGLTDTEVIPRRTRCSANSGRLDGACPHSDEVMPASVQARMMRAMAFLEAIEASPLGRQRGVHRWVMAEVPSVAYWIPTYAAMGIDGVSIGSNDLTQLMLGVDRDSEVCAELFDESDPAVLDAEAQVPAPR